MLSATVARKRAYEAAGKALELDPNNARAFAALAIFQLADGRHDDAIASVRRAAALNPGDAEAKANLALVLAYSGELDEAVTAIAEAMRLNPKPPPGFLQVAGMVHTLAGKYEVARAELETVAAAWPASETRWEYLAACYAALGRTDEARKLDDLLDELSLRQSCRLSQSLHRLVPQSVRSRSLSLPARRGWHSRMASRLSRGTSKLAFAAKP